MPDNNVILDVILEKIFKAIVEQRITAKECLLKSSVNTSFLSDWKNGKIKSPPFDKIYRIAKFLNLSLDYLTDNNISDSRIRENESSDNEKSLLEDFKKLEKREQQIVLGKISEMIYNKKVEESSEKLSSKVLWDLLADQNSENAVVSKHND